MSFIQLDLSEPLLNAISEQGYSRPTPVQKKAIPLILQGQDMLVGAQTGTGKTAGFALPLLQLLHNQPLPQKPQPIRALILTPTRELAMQVNESIRAYGRYLPLFSEVVFGGVSIHSQISRLKQGADILVATPGRLLDIFYRRQIDLGQVQFFVLDEADRMLDMGFIKDIRKVIKELPEQRQNLLFSATYDKEVKTLAAQLLQNPLEVAVARENITADKVAQRIYAIKREYKRELISWLIGHGNWQQVLVFVRTRHGADRLCKQLLKDGIRCVALHGDKSQGARSRALAGFKEGKVTVLIATDIASRGLDIDQLPHVVNFDLPALAEDYIHRIGRTGRAGAEGNAISLVAPEEAYLLAAIEKILKKPIPRVADTGYEPVSLNVGKSTNARTSNSRSKKTGHRTQKTRPSSSKKGARNSGRKQFRKPGRGQ